MKLSTMWGVFIHQKQYCEAHDFAQRHGRECGGWLEAAHIINKSQSRYLKYHNLNGLCLCRDCHDWLDSTKATFYELVEELYPGRMEILQELRMVMQKPDEAYWRKFYRENAA